MPAPPNNVILTWDEETSNSRWYVHIGCDLPWAAMLWFSPLDDCPTPTAADAECAHCCMVFPLLVAH